MAWEENPRICLHMQLIAILSRTGVSICLLQVSHAVPYPVWRAAADYLFLRAKGGFPAGMIMGQETLAASCPFSLYI